VEVALSNSDLGKRFKYELRVFNSEGSTSSTSVRLLFATEPPKPSQGPIITEIKANSMLISYASGTLVNNGSPILSHHLQYAESFLGDWIDVNGLENESLLTYFEVTGLTRGKQFSYRYRVKNSIGWSPFSDLVSGVAAVPPGKLQIPSLIEVTANTIKLALDTNVDSGGSVVTEYILERNQGTAGSAFQKVTTYVSGSLQHTITVAEDLMIAGKIYTFRWYAKNVFGDGERSDEVTIALAANPVDTT